MEEALALVGVRRHEGPPERGEQHFLPRRLREIEHLGRLYCQDREPELQPQT